MTNLFRATFPFCSDGECRFRILVIQVDGLPFARVIQKVEVVHYFSVTAQKKFTLLVNQAPMARLIGSPSELPRLSHFHSYFKTKFIL